MKRVLHYLLLKFKKNIQMKVKFQAFLIIFHSKALFSIPQEEQKQTR
jgi:hypothetical protein